MTLHNGEKKFLGRALLVSAALLVMLAFAGVPRASADEYDRCQRRIAKADHRLHEAIEHHGWDRRQADPYPPALQEATASCLRGRQRRWVAHRLPTPSATALAA